MNFELNDDQRAYADMAKSFSDKELEPFAAYWDERQVFPKETLARAGKLGLCGLYAPVSCGGLGLSRLDSSLIFEELARGCTSTTAFITIHNMATWMICEFGKESVKSKWGSDLTSGRKLASYCLTEPNAGSDAGSLSTKATLRGDHYIIDGAKIFSSGAGDTDLLLVMARTGASGTSGISAFVLKSNTEGISFGRKESKLGWNSQPTRSIAFDQVKVPKEQMLGEEGDGFKIAMMGLDGGRINIASCSIGTAQIAFEKARDFTHERKQFGKSISQFQGLRFKLADMNTNLVCARQMVRLGASKLDTNHPDKTVYCAMAKRMATDKCFWICDEAMQIFGGIGYIKEYPLERYLRDTRVHRILEGTNEIMRLIISNRVLNDASENIL